MEFEVVTIANVECLARFESNYECVSVDLILATNTGLQKLKALIPHNAASLDRENAVPQDYKSAVIATLEQWIKDGKLSPTTYNSSKLYYLPEFRGYADFWQIDLTYPITSIDLVSEYCKSCSLESILQARGEDFMNERERKDFQQRCDFWKQQNRAYLGQKARDFASFWVKCLGTFGSSGDGRVDAMYAFATKSDRIHPTNTDTEKLYEVIYTWAMSEFDRAWIPFLDTDYGVRGEVKELLEKNSLAHLKSAFPIKTWMHLNFDDLDRAALDDSAKEKN